MKNQALILTLLAIFAIAFVVWYFFIRSPKYMRRSVRGTYVPRISSAALRRGTDQSGWVRVGGGYMCNGKYCAGACCAGACVEDDGSEFPCSNAEAKSLASY